MGLQSPSVIEAVGGEAGRRLQPDQVEPVQVESLACACRITDNLEYRSTWCVAFLEVHVAPELSSARASEDEGGG